MFLGEENPSLKVQTRESKLLKQNNILWAESKVPDGDVNIDG